MCSLSRWFVRAERAVPGPWIRDSPLQAEAVAAPARFLGARIVELDAGPQQSALVVHQGPVEDLERARIHEHRESFVLEHEVVRPARRRESHEIGIAGTAARLDSKTECLSLLAFLGSNPEHPLDRCGGHGDRSVWRAGRTGPIFSS